MLGGDRMGQFNPAGDRAGQFMSGPGGDRFGPPLLQQEGLLEGGEKKPPLGMLIRGFPSRSTDTSIRDGLFHEYKKFGKVLSVMIVGQGEQRHAIVTFKKWVSSFTV